METKGCIKLKDQKGVLSITDINKENELYIIFYIFLFILNLVDKIG